MSELMNTEHRYQADFRWRLLMSVSVAALVASAYTSGLALADGNADRPTVWIELGGQLDRLTNQREAFDPPFMASITQANLLSALNVQQQSAYSLGEEGKISFQSDSSDWVFSASVQYGRSQAARHLHQQTPNAKVPAHFTVPSFGGKYENIGTKYPNRHVKFSDGTASQSETHTILDFQAGKDVGLGMFGSRGFSMLSVGVRFAQLSSKANVTLRAEPDLQYPANPITSLPGYKVFKYAPIHFHDYAGMENSQRSFRGLGPALAWNGLVPLAGEINNGELTLDWGTNAAVLFGRQKSNGYHHTVDQTYYENKWNLTGNVSNARGRFINKTLSAQHGGGAHAYYSGQAIAHHSNTENFNRVRTVVVPNLGGFAGLSVRYADAKVSFGYRADFFFGAMDEGIDTRQAESVGFHGPFATISVGLGG